MLSMYQEKTSPNITKLSDEAPKTSRFNVLGNKLFVISLGCPRNLVDTEVMLGILLKSGYEVAEELEESDYIIINTCGFLHSARQESIDAITEALEEKKTGAKVIVTGCMVQSHSDEIKRLCPEVDYLLGSGDVESILKAVEAEEQGSHISFERSYLEAGETPRKLSTPQHYAYLKIAEGCRKRCAYCIIPDIKGPLKSKPLERVVKEFKVLLDQGVKEVILIAQDLGDWGRDAGFSKGTGLPAVLRELLKDDREYWLRLLYLYPDEITDDVIEIMKSDKRICPYLDMPIQHINDDILKAMHRTTSKEQIINTLDKLRAEIPNICIRTSLIVGHPGETKKHFSELKDFLKDSPLDNVGIFPYSIEEGTVSAGLKGHVPEKEKEKRQSELAELQQSIVEELNAQYIGKTLQVIVEGYHPDSNFLMRGRHQGQAPEIDGEVIINDCRRVEEFAQWYDVEITDCIGYDLVGTAIAKSLSIK